MVYNVTDKLQEVDSPKRPKITCIIFFHGRVIEYNCLLEQCGYIPHPVFKTVMNIYLLGVLGRFASPR